MKNEFRLIEEKAMCIIFLTKGQSTAINIEDMPLVADHKWHVIERDPGKFYAATSSHYYTKGKKPRRKTKPIYMHRLLMNDPENQVIAHKNRITLDNRRENLMIIDHVTPTFDKKKFKRKVTSLYSGVSYNKDRNKWYVRFYINGKSKTFGYYNEEIAAAKAADFIIKDLKLPLSLNFPDIPKGNQNGSGMEFVTGKKCQGMVLERNGSVTDL